MHQQSLLSFTVGDHEHLGSKLKGRQGLKLAGLNLRN